MSEGLLAQKGLSPLCSYSMPTLIHLFGYGSLIATPEHGDTVIGNCLGALAGHRRVFNKRSPSRGCPVKDSFDVFKSDVPGEFIVDHQNHSLAVGTVVAPDEMLYGALVSYESDNEKEMLEATDKREGYDAMADKATLGYLRAQVKVSRPDKSDVVDAWVYLSNPGGAYHLCDTTPASMRAKILIRATPRPDTATARNGRALGLHYLEQIRNGLARWSVVDQSLEAIAFAVHEIPGPWVKLVAKPVI